MMTLTEIEAAEHKLVDALARLRMQKSAYLTSHPDILRKSNLKVTSRSPLVDNTAVAEMISAARDRAAEGLRLSKAARPSESSILESLKPSNLRPAVHPALLGWH
jgi:hypothetical protein